MSPLGPIRLQLCTDNLQINCNKCLYIIVCRKSKHKLSEAQLLSQKYRDTDILRYLFVNVKVATDKHNGSDDIKMINVELITK